MMAASEDSNLRHKIKTLEQARRLCDLATRVLFRVLLDARPEHVLVHRRFHVCTTAMANEVDSVCADLEQFEKKKQVDQKIEDMILRQQLIERQSNGETHLQEVRRACDALQQEIKVVERKLEEKRTAYHEKHSNVDRV